jgi:predicted TIM-barrel fold metal-dependent hydrolase
VVFYPLYDAIQELGVPTLFHTGQTGIGAGLPGGRGIKLRYSNPMLLDDVAADFPHLMIVLAHPSVPWQDEAISIATHKANAYIDLSGWSPKYFPAQLVRAANGPLRHKVMFGSDFPVITPDRWLADFARLDIKDEVRPLILKDNAARLLRLS